MPSQSELKAHFSDVTGVSVENAAKFLAKYKWDFNAALDAYLSNSHKMPAANSSRPAKALVDIYNKYKDPENDAMISIEGTLAYLGDLGIEPEDPRSLTLAYLLKSPQTGEFSRSAFLAFWSEAKISTVPAMTRLIDHHHTTIKKSVKEFEDFYVYCFDFVRGSNLRIKSISTEDAVMYWQLIFGEREDLKPSADRLSQWYEYLESTEKAITKDTWVMFHKFLHEIINKDPESLSGYDEMSSWPSLVDEYVEWLEENDRLIRADS